MLFYYLRGENLQSVDIDVFYRIAHDRGNLSLYPNLELQGKCLLSIAFNVIICLMNFNIYNDSC